MDPAAAYRMIARGRLSHDASAAKKLRDAAAFEREFRRQRRGGQFKTGEPIAGSGLPTDKNSGPTNRLSAELNLCHAETVLRSQQRGCQ